MLGQCAKGEPERETGLDGIGRDVEMPGARTSTWTVDSEGTSEAEIKVSPTVVTQSSCKYLNFCKEIRYKSTRLKDTI